MDFQLEAPYKPDGDQPQAIEELMQGLAEAERDQVLLGVTGSGKTFTMAKVIEETQRPALVVGFAAETEKLLAHARAKLKRKGCDWIVANDVSPATGIMGGTENAVVLITGEGSETWPRMDKSAVAARLAERIAAALA